MGDAARRRTSVSSEMALRSVALSCAVALLFVGCDPGPSRNDAPDFSLETLRGEDTLSLADFRGRTLVIDFWATWCAPCVEQIPHLNAFAAEYDDVALVGIAVDAEGRDVVAPFAEVHGINYPVLLGDEGLARRFGAPGFPTLAVVDPGGRVSSLHIGLVDPEILREAVETARR